MESFANTVFRNGNIDENRIGIFSGRREKSIEFAVELVSLDGYISIYQIAAGISLPVAMDLELRNGIPFPKLVLNVRHHNYSRHLTIHSQSDAVATRTGYLSGKGHIVGSGNLVRIRLVGRDGKVCCAHAVRRRIASGKGHLGGGPLKVLARLRIPGCAVIGINYLLLAVCSHRNPVPAFECSLLLGGLTHRIAAGGHEASAQAVAHLRRDAHGVGVAAESGSGVFLRAGCDQKESRRCKE